MHCGTTIDTFLRENLVALEGFKLGKVNAIASMGVVHKGHLKESMKILELYLPKPGMTASQEGGHSMPWAHPCNKGGKGDAEVTTTKML